MNAEAQQRQSRDLIVVRSLGRQEYAPLWRAMQAFTDRRDGTTPDEIWFSEHPPVFTLGLNASREHLLNPGDIPTVQIDRGGQVTYHGPGELMIYPLVDLRRAGLGVRDMVTALEQSVVDLVADHSIEASSRKDAPGVYVDDRKIASVGLRVRRGATYHGMALNIDVDLEPFSRINPCGYSDLEVSNLAALGVSDAMPQIQEQVQRHLLRNLGMQDRDVITTSGGTATLGSE